MARTSVAKPSLLENQKSKQSLGELPHHLTAPDLYADVLSLQGAVGNRAINQLLRSPGQPLAPSTRTFMESRFDHDFSSVRIHSDAQAAKSAQTLNAAAYTAGQDIVFGARRYTPETEAGQRLLAHELAHTIQQRSQRQVVTPLPLQSSAEGAANRAATAITQGETIPQLGSTPVGIARQPNGNQPGKTPQLPRRQIRLDSIKATYPGDFKTTKGVIRIDFTAEVDGKTVNWGFGLIEPKPDGSLKVLGLELDTRVKVQDPSGKPQTVILEQPKGFSFTRFALEKTVEVYQDRAGYPPPELGGELDKNNLRNFQKEFAKLRKKYPNMSSENLARLAIKRVSFGKHRVALGYDQFDLELGKGEKINFGGKLGEVEVPSFVEARVTRSKPWRGRPPGGSTPKGGQPSGPAKTPKTPPAKSSAAPPRGRRAGTTAPLAPGLTLRSTLTHLGAGVALGIFTGKLKQYMAEELANLPEPKFDRRKAADYLRDPKTKAAIRTADLLHKNFRRFGRELWQHHWDFSGAVVLAVGRIRHAALEQLSHEEARDQLLQILDEIEVYEAELATIAENLDFAIDQEKAALQSAESADELYAMIDNPLMIYYLFYGAGFTLEEIGLLLKNLRGFSYRVKQTFKMIRELKQQVGTLQDEIGQLAKTVNDDYWDEVLSLAAAK